MYDMLIGNYVKQLSIDDVDDFATQNDIFLDDDEKKIVYDYVKKYWKVFYKGDPTDVLKELKGKLKKENYDKGITLYNQYKSKINY